MIERFGCLMGEPPQPSSPDALEAIARACVPRVERHADVVLFDASGLDRVIGPPPELARALDRLAADRGLRIRLALAGSRTAAWLLVHARSGHTIVSSGRDAEAVSPLALEWLLTLPSDLVDRARRHERASVVRDGAERLAVLHAWGLHTLGAFAALPRADVHARLGPDGVRWHVAAGGVDARPLVPSAEEARFVERCALEWPIDGLEPLTFVVGRLCDAHEIALERADRGAVRIDTRLTLVTRAVHVRTLHLPAPIRDSRVLRTLVRLDLESHPPDAAIDVVEIALGVMPGRVEQGGLWACALPSAETLTTLIARLGALMGDTRVGAPALVDTADERAVALRPFVLRGRSSPIRPAAARSPRRRLPLPIAARVTTARGRPMRVEPSATGLSGGPVAQAAGPWRSSGAWWTPDGRTWDRDAWDVELTTGGVYSMSRDRTTDRWSIDAIVD